jgi:hypothetical protein
MSKVTGRLEKAYRNKQGFYSILINDVWYGTGKSDYTELEGNMVEFNTVQKGNFVNVTGDVLPLAEQAAPANTGAPAAPVMGADTRQQSIVLQSSYKTAGELVAGLIAADKLPLGAKKDAFDLASGFLDEMARHIYDNCIDPATFLAGDDPAPADGEWKPTEA